MIEEETIKEIKNKVVSTHGNLITEASILTIIYLYEKRKNKIGDI